MCAVLLCLLCLLYLSALPGEQHSACVEVL